MIQALVGYQFEKCEVVFSLVILSCSWTFLVPLHGLKYCVCVFYKILRRKDFKGNISSRIR